MRFSYRNSDVLEAESESELSEGSKIMTLNKSFEDKAQIIPPEQQQESDKVLIQQLDEILEK